MDRLRTLAKNIGIAYKELNTKPHFVLRVLAAPQETRKHTIAAVKATIAIMLLKRSVYTYVAPTNAKAPTAVGTPTTKEAARALSEIVPAVLMEVYKPP